MAQDLDVAIIGGGAAGLFAANLLGETPLKVALLEKNDRVGKKLLATGNGQCNLSNVDLSLSHYRGNPALVARVFAAFPPEKTKERLQAAGIYTAADERGRIYPLSRQASAVLDLLRADNARKGVEERVQTEVTEILPKRGGFIVKTSAGEVAARRVIVAAGGKSGTGFGTEGRFYPLLTALGHTLTELTPSLVAVKADTTYLKNLKGLRVDAAVSLLHAGITERGDLLFTDNGLSGDAIFRLSARLPNSMPARAEIAFLPDLSEEEVVQILQKKQAILGLNALDLLHSLLHKQLAKNLLRALGVAEVAPAAELSAERLADRIKHFPVKITDTVGFSHAQVTRGGISGEEVDPDTLESLLVPGLFLSGEILDVDGDCGGYNLQWAFSSGGVAALAAADSLLRKR